MVIMPIARTERWIWRPWSHARCNRQNLDPWEVPEVGGLHHHEVLSAASGGATEVSCFQRLRVFGTDNNAEEVGEVINRSTPPLAHR